MNSLQVQLEDRRIVRVGSEVKYPRFVWFEFGTTKER